MRRIVQALRNFFFPPADAKTFVRLMPLFAVALIMIVVFAASTYAWEESNSSVFCGTACHTMPPEYVTYQNSAHTNVSCEDCHMGRDRLPVMIQRKVRYSWQTGTAMLFGTYEFPIRAHNMAPAREACENCHKPEKFSTDTLREFRTFGEDETNTDASTYMVVKTGGGTSRQGLGYGIHWHIENPVSFYATDGILQQEIPYVVVEKADGTKVEYLDVESDFDPSTVNPDEMVTMDCITCHNRTAHLVESPNQVMDSLMTRGLVSKDLAGIKKRGAEILSVRYEDEAAALKAIAGLEEEYAAQPELANQAVAAMQEAWQRTNFPNQEVYWDTHPNNLAHRDSPGCLRCHDGKHLTEAEEAIRLECNLCHSIPTVSAPRELTALVELGRGFEPESHKHPNWIAMHNEIFDQTCEGCHTTDDPGGTSNTSFCSNSACHGASWEFAGFDAPKLRAILQEQAKAYIAPPSESSGAAGGAVEGALTYHGAIGAMLNSTCASCHGDAALAGLNVTTYAALMQGADSGPVVVEGDPAASPIVTVQQEGGHPGQLSDDQIEALIQWIEAGAPEGDPSDAAGAGSAEAGESATPAATEAPAETEAPAAASDVSWEGRVFGMFEEKCSLCHGDTGGFNAESYADVMKAVTPGDPDNSKVVQVQIGDHPGLFDNDEFDLLREWIEAGAPER